MRLLTLGLLALAAVAAVLGLLDLFAGEEGVAGTVTTATTAASPSTTAAAQPIPPAVPRSSIGKPWGTVEGLAMFRGNPTRSWFGSGPVPTDPGLLWTYPDAKMCSRSLDLGEESEWCGTGWTGQPLVWTNPDGRTEVLFGAYDGAVHFVDATTGEPTRPPYETGDLIKGFGALDPDGFPLLYFGSRDNKFRIVALDRSRVVELWSMDAHDVDGVWNDDWDSSPVIVNGILYVGGENGWFYAIELNRSYGTGGRVRVRPEVLLALPSYDDDFLAMLNPGRTRPASAELPNDGGGTDADWDEEVSIENSPVVLGNRVFFANSGGRILGLDIRRIEQGRAPVVFDYWAGGDVDATIAVDRDGMLYVGIEFEPNDKAGKPPMRDEEVAHQRAVGQLIKLDPSAEGDPRIWGVDLTAGGQNAGIWGSPVVYRGVVYAPTHTGELLAVDAGDGEVLWRDSVGYGTWSSPLIVDGVLIQATDQAGIRAYSLQRPRRPERMWTVELPEGGEIESTPAMWDGAIYVGSRNGYFYKIGDQ